MIRSESITELLKSLHAVQAELKPVKRDNENTYHHSRYATLGAISEAVMPVLNKHGLMLVQPAVKDDVDGFAVETILYHTSGEFLGSQMSIPLAKPDPQGLGSAYTYARRYMLSGLLGIVTDDDDDGNAHRQELELRRANAPNVVTRVNVPQNTNARQGYSTRTASQTEKRNTPAVSTSNASQGVKTQSSNAVPADESDDVKRDRYVGKIEVLRSEIDALKGDPGQLPNVHQLTLDELAEYGLDLRDQRDRLQRTRDGEKVTGRGAGPPARLNTTR